MRIITGTPTDDVGRRVKDDSATGQCQGPTEECDEAGPRPLWREIAEALEVNPPEHSRFGTREQDVMAPAPAQRMSRADVASEVECRLADVRDGAADRCDPFVLEEQPLRIYEPRLVGHGARVEERNDRRLEGREAFRPQYRPPEVGAGSLHAHVEPDPGPPRRRPCVDHDDVCAAATGGLEHGIDGRRRDRVLVDIDEHDTQP